MTRFLIIGVVLTAFSPSVTSKIPVQVDNDLFDYDTDDTYSDLMRERYRKYCLENLEKSFSSWKLL